MAKDDSRCAFMVLRPPHYFRVSQCSRRPGHGSDDKYCRQHAAKIAAREARIAEHYARTAKERD